MRAYQNNCDFQYRQNFYVHLVEHTPNMENPTFVFNQYLPILGCRASKANFWTRYRIQKFFLKFFKNQRNYPKTRIFCKKKYFAWWFVWKKCFFWTITYKKFHRSQILKFWDSEKKFRIRLEFTRGWSIFIEINQLKS